MIENLFRQVRAALGGDGFESTIRDLAAALGTPPHFGDTAAGIAVPLDGHTYAVVVERLPTDRVQITAHSNIAFTRGRLPSDVASLLADRNRQLPHCDWRTFDGPRWSNFVVVTNVRPGEFDADTLRSALREVIPEVAALDKTLADAGYSRRN